MQSVHNDTLNKMLYIQSAEQQVLKHFAFNAYLRTLLVCKFVSQVVAICSEFVTIKTYVQTITNSI